MTKKQKKVLIPDHYCSGIGDRFAVYPGERIRAVRTVYDSVFCNRI